MSVFKNSCHAAPKKGLLNSKKGPKTASTSLPNLSDRAGDTDTEAENSRPQTVTGGGEDWSGPAVPKGNHSAHKIASPLDSTPAPDSSVPSVPHTVVGRQQPADDYATLFQTLLDSNSLLHKEITRLRRDHNKAMSRIALFNRDHGSAKRWDQKAEGLGGNQRLKGNRDTRTCEDGFGVLDSFSESSGDRAQKRPMKDNVASRSEDECSYEPSVTYDTPDEFYYDDSDSDNHSVKSIEPYRITYISSSSSEDVSTCSSQYSSPLKLVGRMWEDFSVGDYPVEDFSEAFHKQGDEDKRWAHKVTIPKPFSMTVREANARKKMSRSMVIAEKEQAEREAILHARTLKQFHASPVPASTYLPLHDLINAKNAHRRALVKKMSGHMLKSSQKPFKFAKRDAERKQQTSEWLKQAREQEITQLREKPFKAKPVPHRLFDPAVDEEAEEREEYRRIRSRVRAEELLEKSRAPYTMRLQNAKAKGNPTFPFKSPSRPRVRNNFTFHPRITHKIPNYKKAYERLQQDLLLKKQSKLTTVSEPFNLHTEKRAKTRQLVETNIQSDSGIEEKLEKVPFIDEPLPNPPVMTETARRRQLLTREKLEESLLRNAAEEDQDKERKKREKRFQKIVMQKSSGYDLTEFLEEKKKLKMQEMRLVKCV
jgi:hypothetical protein